MRDLFFLVHSDHQAQKFMGQLPVMVVQLLEVGQ